MLARPAEGLYKEKGSKFISYAFPVSSEVEIKENLDKLRKQHPKARHHCYAFRLMPDGQLYRANDDGEPSGTAGRPILGQLISLDLTNSLVVVVRYFGGTLLGASGLIRAYKQSAQDVLANAEITQKYLASHYRIEFPYAKMGTVMDVLKKYDAAVIEQQFHLKPTLTIGFKKNLANAALIDLKAGVGAITREEAETLEAVEGLELTFLETK